MTKQDPFLAIQGDFPIRKNLVYLNNASIGALSNRVVAAVDAFLEDVRQSGRIHYPDWCRHADGRIKADIGRLIGAEGGEIAFVKNTTEGLLIVANGIDWREGDNVILADIEYPSNVYCWLDLQRKGVQARWVHNRAGRILVEDAEALIDSRTRLVSLSGVQFSNGFRLDLARLCEVCRPRGVLVNLDMIQWVGAVDLELSRFPVDYLSVGGHKWLLAPIGTGFFYCRKGSMDRLHVQNVGYHSVDKSEDHLDYDLSRLRPHAGRFEEALVNFPGIWGLHAAVLTLLELGMTSVQRHILRLGSLAAEGLRSKGYTILSPQGEGERSGILCFKHPSAPVEETCRRLEEAKVHLAIRAGGLRISPSIYNDEGDIRALLDALP